MSICQNATFQLRYQNESCSECHQDVILKREGGTRDKMIINSTQKVSSRVLKSRNMMSVARTSYFGGDKVKVSPVIVTNTNLFM